MGFECDFSKSIHAVPVITGSISNDHSFPEGYFDYNGPQKKTAKSFEAEGEAK